MFENPETGFHAAVEECTSAVGPYQWLEEVELELEQEKVKGRCMAQQRELDRKFSSVVQAGRFDETALREVEESSGWRKVNSDMCG